jgi:hypothetical protein
MDRYRAADSCSHRSTALDHPPGFGLTPQLLGSTLLAGAEAATMSASAPAPAMRRTCVTTPGVSENATSHLPDATSSDSSDGVATDTTTDSQTYSGTNPWQDYGADTSPDQHGLATIGPLGRCQLAELTAPGRHLRPLDLAGAGAGSVATTTPATRGASESAA